jgi:hypothetical protein
VPGEVVLRAFSEGKLSTVDGQIAVPLLYREETMGVVWISDLGSKGGDEDLDTLARLSREAAVLLWSARVTDDLESGKVEIEQLLKMD